MQIAKALAKKGHETIVCTSDTKDLKSGLSARPVENLDGIEIHYLRDLPAKYIENLFVTPGLVSRAIDDAKNFDVVHLHGHWLRFASAQHQ